MVRAEEDPTLHRRGRRFDRRRDLLLDQVSDTPPSGDLKTPQVTNALSS